MQTSERCERCFPDKKLALNIRATGFDELRGTEVAYSSSGELGIYLPNVVRNSPPRENSSCFPTLTSPNPLKRYYDSVRQPGAQYSTSRLQYSDPCPASIQEMSPSPSNAAATANGIPGLVQQRPKKVRFDTTSAL